MSATPDIPDDSSDQERNFQALRQLLSEEKERARAADQRASELERELSTEREARVRLEERSNSRTPEPPREHSRADLAQMVEDGQLTQAQADRIWEQQQENRIDRMVSDRVQAQITQHQTRAAVEAELGRYRQAMPQAWQNGTQERQKVAAAVHDMMAKGAPNTTLTDLLALRQVFGPIEALETNLETRRDPNRQGATPDGGGDEGGGGDDGRLPSWLTGPQRAHYENLLSMGMYDGEKGEKDLKAELEILRKKRGK